jgi:hypothetical protein
MANKEQILDKIARSMKLKGHSAERVGESVELVKVGGDVLTVSYVDASFKTTSGALAPMGGIDSSVSPFLGIGVGNPGKIKIKGEAGETSIALIMDTAEALDLLNVVSGFANDIIIEDGDSSNELARLSGHADLVGMGS